MIFSSLRLTTTADNTRYYSHNYNHYCRLFTHTNIHFLKFFIELRNHWWLWLRFWFRFWWFCHPPGHLTDCLPSSHSYPPQNHKTFSQNTKQNFFEQISKYRIFEKFSVRFFLEKYRRGFCRLVITKHLASAALTNEIVIQEIL